MADPYKEAKINVDILQQMLLHMSGQEENNKEFMSTHLILITEMIDILTNLKKSIEKELKKLPN